MLNELKNHFNETETLNGDKAFKSTNNVVLDFFSASGAMRNTPKSIQINTFMKAYFEDKNLALKALFYSRDVREGQGERELFRTIFNHLAINYPEDVKYLIPHIAEYGRWDDLFILIGTSLEDEMINIIKNQLASDLISDNPSLLAKWMPTINASSYNTRKLAHYLANELNMSEIHYRKTISSLRKQIGIVETEMSFNNWHSIDYSTVPSKASMNYRNAFKRHDEERYSAFIKKAINGEMKINSSTLYPYEIYDKISREDNTLEALWNALPNYVQNENALVMADVSSSMTGRPMSVSVSLALYYAERNKGVFANHYMSFSNIPLLIQIRGNTLYEKMNFIEHSNVGYNTDLRLALRKILKVAINNRVPQSEMPSKLYIISDMQFDCEDITGNSTFTDISIEFNEEGYNLPEIVFWNVENYGTKPTVAVNKSGVQLVSGFSPNLFSQITSGLSAIDLMLDILNSERYDIIHI
jgi:hypothetical protein